MNILSYDGLLMTSLRKLVNYVLLGILWIIASVPLITFGAATTAMFFTAEKAIHLDNGKLFSTFLKCFCREFKQATILWLIALVLLMILTVNILILMWVELPSFVTVILVIPLLLGFGWLQLWFGYLSRFEDTTRVLLINTIRMTLMNFPYILLLVVLAITAIGGALTSMVFLPFLFLIPGLYVMLARFVTQKHFSKYIPETKEITEIVADC